MQLGQRIKQARLLHHLTQRDISNEVGVTYQAISKYENGMDVPSTDVLLRLAKALNVKPEFFFRSVKVVLSSPISYRKLQKVKDSAILAIKAQLQEWLERYLEVESIFTLDYNSINRPGLPPPIEVNSMDDVENAAQQLRDYWQLGIDPINNLIDTLEDNGVKVGIIDGVSGFDALAFNYNEHSVIAIKKGVPGDRQRFNLAHELGHLLLRIPDDKTDKEVEKYANRFAGAFLVPASSVKSELQDKRRNISIEELHMLKHEYGMSMQAWIYRAHNLEIISKNDFDRFFKGFNARGKKLEEPGDPYPCENPQRMKRLILQALAEELITVSKAAELIGMTIQEFRMSVLIQVKSA